MADSVRVWLAVGGVWLAVGGVWLAVGGCG